MYAALLQQMDVSDFEPLELQDTWGNFTVTPEPPSSEHMNIVIKGFPNLKAWTTYLSVQGRRKVWWCDMLSAIF